MSDQIFRNIMYASDRSGTMKWRRIWPLASVDCIASGENIQADYSQTPILDQNYYKNITSVTVQRWISKDQHKILTKFLKPLCDGNMAWLIYEIDDAMHYDEIPLFNRGRMAYASDETQMYIKEMLNAADLITVTTDYIKNYYHKKYGVPLENIVAIPNLLPRYLFGDRYDPVKKVEQYSKFKAKPRIGIVSSLSHYNVDNIRVSSEGKAVKLNVNNNLSTWIDSDNKEVDVNTTNVITDDLDEILDCIRSTVDDFQWVFFGYCPPKLNDLVAKKKIEYHSGSPIMNYASVLSQLQLQAIVAPIKDIEFNRCKSFIKYMEAASVGVPLFASNYLPYNRMMPEAQRFNSSDDLKAKLMKLKFQTSSGAYRSLIESQWKWLNSPCHEGDFDLKNFWLEDNLSIWTSLFKLRQKTLTIDFSNFVAQHEKRLAKEKESTIYKTDDGLLITK